MMARRRAEPPGLMHAHLWTEGGELDKRIPRTGRCENHLCGELVFDWRTSAGQSHMAASGEGSLRFKVESIDGHVRIDLLLPSPGAKDRRGHKFPAPITMRIGAEGSVRSFALADFVDLIRQPYVAQLT